MSPAKNRRPSRHSAATPADAAREAAGQLKPIRLQRFLAECGIASRRKAEDLITSGRVTVNGRPAVLGMRIDPRRDKVRLSGDEEQLREKGVALFNKPTGVVSTKHDPQGRKTIRDFVPKRMASYFPVGRLDYDSCGLVVLTNDGELADVMLHPRYEVARSYEVKVSGAIEDEMRERARAGIELDDGTVRAELKVLKNGPPTAWVEVTLHEGRNRIVRRMFEKLGRQVLVLKRTKHGPFDLGGRRRGELRQLPPRRYRALREKLLKKRKG